MTKALRVVRRAAAITASSISGMVPSHVALSRNRVPSGVANALVGRLPSLA
jgi:hypothetical protein